MKLYKKLMDLKNTKKILCILMVLFLAFGSIIPVFVYASSTTFRVSTSEEFINAVRTINAGADDKEYVIEMLNDITITDRAVGGNNASLEFRKGITTIYGNNFVLSSSYPTDSVIYADGNSVLNLGSATEPEKSKLYFNSPDATTSHPDLLGINGNATVNVYDGVVFQNNIAQGRPGGAISVGEFESTPNAKLNMYGGIIRNCQDIYSTYGGAIFVGIDATFNMYNGRIENNKSGYGGGVFNMGSFTMHGGIIENNNAEIGGGVFNAASFTMEGGVIQNNTATTAADDIFSQGVMKLGVAANRGNDFGTLTSTSKQINGWFEDGNERWNGNDYCLEVTTEEASSMLEEGKSIALKAAHNANVNVTFDVNAGVWQDTSDKFIDNTNNTYSQSLAIGTTADKPVDPTKTDYKFLGWFTKDGAEYDFTIAVNEDITLYAKWEYNNYKKSVTLDKTYLIKDGYTGAGDRVTSEGKLTENITLVIETYNSFNREGNRTDIPKFAQDNYTFKTGIGADEIQIALPDFKDFGIGDYWYKVTELEGNTAGVTYDTNAYYMHIVVTREDDLNPDDCGISQITFHKNTPSEDGTYKNSESDKTTGITNTYAVGSLSVTKDIKGNFADHTKKFEIVVTFNAPEGKIVTGDIYYGDNQTVVVAANDWKESVAKVTIKLGIGDTVEFKNIPDGVTYTVSEKNYSSEGYENPVYSFDGAEEIGDTISVGSQWSDNKAQGTITDDTDIVTITNEKNATIDVGVFFENAPFVALILLVGAMSVLMIITRRREMIDVE